MRSPLGAYGPECHSPLPRSIVQGTKVLQNHTFSFCCAFWAGSTVLGSCFLFLPPKTIQEQPQEELPNSSQAHRTGPQFSHLWMRRASPTGWWTSIASASLLTVVQNTVVLGLAPEPLNQNCIWKPGYLTWGFPGGARGKERACQGRRHETQVWSLGREDP